MTATQHGRASRPVRARALIRVLIVGDIRLYREGLALVLSSRETIGLVGTAETAEEALARARALRPDVVLLDLAMARALALIETLSVKLPDVRTVALTVPEVERAVIDCAEAGVAGYVTRNGSIEDLLSAIDDAAKGDMFCPSHLVGMLARRVAAVAHAQVQAPPESVLTPRELEVARLIGDGLSNKEIATCLYIEVATVKHHVHNVLEKLQVQRRSQAAGRLREHRI